MNISKKTRFFSLVLGILMLCACFLTACNSDGDTEETTAATTLPPAEETKEITIENWLPIKDYGENGGAGEVTLLTFNTYNNNYMLIQQEDSADPLRSEAYSRTQKIQEKFNVALKPIETNKVTDELQASLMGQGGEYDIIYPHPDNATPITELALVVDLYSFENIHLDEPWWNQSVETFTIDGKIFFAASDYSICGQGLPAYIYNRDLWRELQLDQKYDLNTLIHNKEWNIFLFRQIVMEYGSDVDNNDKYDLQDRYGLLFGGGNPYFWSMGGQVISKDSNGEYYLSLDIDRTSSMATALYDLVFSSEHKVFELDATSWAQFPNSEGWTAFKTGQSLFMQYELGAMFNLLPQVKFDLGYAPLPLYENGQDYRTLCGAGFFMIPKKTENPERNSIILEALCIDSYTGFRDVFFHTILLGRLSNVEEDYEMLKMLHESKIYDLGYTWAKGGSNVLLKNVILNRDPNVAAVIKGRWREMSKTLEYIEMIRNGVYSQ